MAIRLLMIVGPLHIAVGLLLFLTAFFPALQQQFANALGLSLDQHSTFLLAVLGPTIASWGVLFAAVARQFADYPTGRLWGAMLCSVLVWAIFDTGLCLYFGVTGAVIVNAVVILILLAVLFNVRSARA